MARLLATLMCPRGRALPLALLESRVSCPPGAGWCQITFKHSNGVATTGWVNGWYNTRMKIGPCSGFHHPAFKSGASGEASISEGHISADRLIAIRRPPGRDRRLDAR
jgi:hypothetical protein